MPHAPSATRVAFELHARHFRGAPRAAASAPGRVNLLGEHTDYNGGPVLPMAIDRRTVVVAGRARRFDAASARDGVVDGFDPDRPMRGEWTDYLAGVVRALRRRRAAPTGASLAIASTVPVGAGLSSSAALTVAAAKALSRLAGVALRGPELAEVAFEAEHDEVGVPCGRMDQTIVTHGSHGKALLYETATGAIVPVPFPGAVWVFDTGVSHQLVSSAYAERRRECAEALAVLREQGFPAPHLAAFPPEELPRLLAALPAAHGRRVRHVVTETARTRSAADALRRGDLPRVGALLAEGHASLRDDYESSCPEADVLVDLAVRHGAWGARLTGAGWGGAVIALIDPARAPRVVAEVQEGFRQAYGRIPATWSSRAMGGVRSQTVGKR
ncbi:MAG TPA: galactokinase [Gemmatimonadales bacterium]|nr:galactokinase [Gemmatimonadales bacterium]